MRFLLIAVLLIGCGKDDESSSTNYDVVRGIWKTACLDGGDGDYLMETVDIFDLNINRTTVLYTGADCVAFGSTLKFEMAVPFTLDGAPGEQMNIDYGRATHLILTILLDSYVDAANAEAWYEKSDWEVGVPFSTIGKKIDDESDSDAYGPLYSIVKVDGAMLRFGDPDSGAGTTPATRRKTLVPENAAYIKQ